MTCTSWWKGCKNSCAEVERAAGDKGWDWIVAGIAALDPLCATTILRAVLCAWNKRMQRRCRQVGLVAGMAKRGVETDKVGNRD